MQSETIIINTTEGSAHWMHQLYPSVYDVNGKAIKPEVKLTFQI